MKFAVFLAAFCMAGALVPAQSKIAVVDVNKVIQRSAKGQELFKSITSFLEAKKAEISKSVEAYQEKKNQAADSGLSSQQRLDLARELERMQTDIKRAQEDAERDRKLRLQEGGRKLERELSRVIRQIGQEMKLDLIVNFGSESGILYYSEAIDLTDAVLARYDQAGQ